MISFVDVTKNYYVDDHTAITPVDSVTLDLKRGEFVLIVGRSGSGKTTVLNLAAGLVKPTRGQVLIDGVDVNKMSDGRLASFRSQKMGFVFQFPSLLPALTVLENVALPAVFAPRKQSANAHARAAGLLENLGLKKKLAAYPKQLSAGEQKRVVIARALINGPSILLADEPTSDLDEQTEREVMAVFRGIHSGGITIVMVTHSLELIPYAIRALRMENGVLTDASSPAGERKSRAAT